jgi:predicted SnoaL-like aldol condensation-catalyzing enzyme
MSETLTISHKDTALAFLKLCAAGKPREAFQQYTGPTFRHHNAFFGDTAEELIEGMEESAEAFPHTVLTEKQIIEEGSDVAVFSHVVMEPGNRGLAVVHILRFEGEKIVEFWDVAQPVPENSPNELGMF